MKKLFLSLFLLIALAMPAFGNTMPVQSTSDDPDSTNCPTVPWTVVQLYYNSGTGALETWTCAPGESTYTQKPIYAGGTGSYVEFTDAAAPDAPAAGKTRLFTTAGVLYQRVNGGAADMIPSVSSSPTWTGTHDLTGATVTLPSTAYGDTFLFDFGANVTSATEGILLPSHATDCTNAIAEGQVCWEEDAQRLWVGNGAAAVQMNAAGANSFGIVTDGSAPAGADSAGDTLTVTDSATINFTTSDAPEDLTAAIVANSVDHDELAATITFADGDLVDFGTNVTGTDEGLRIPAHATDCTTATAEGQICWEEGDEALYVGNGVAAVQMNAAAPGTEVRSMYWGAGAMEVDGTQCTAPTAVALVTGGPTPLTIACADNDAGIISGSTTMPDSWNGGTVTFTLVLGQISASTGAYEMDFEGQCIGHDEAFLAFAGTGEQPAQITLTADDDSLQGDTAAVTLNGTTCAAGDVLVWRGAIDATASAASIETLAVVVGVKMEYTSTIGD